jgi:multidrug resistance protein
VRSLYSATLFFGVIFIIPCAVSKNIETLLVCRAIDGIAMSAPLTIVGGTLADVWRKEERGLAMAMFSAAPFLGPILGPLIGGFLSDAKGWRWLYWLQLIIAGTAWCLITFTVPETYAPTILARKAAKLRKETGDPSYTSVFQARKESFSQYLGSYLIRPFKLLFRELIVFLISVYVSIIYGVVYMFFVSFPVIYEQGKGYSAGTTGLMFIPIAVGSFMGLCSSPFVNRDYLTQLAKYNGKAPPEIRLRGMMVGCWTLPLSLFINAWTSYPHLSWAGPALAGIPMGFGFVLIYNSANNYIVDSYQHLAASALAAKTLMRSLWGASVVLFTIQMYNNLGFQWAGSLIAFISLACCPIPFLFYKYGATIRRRSRYAYSGDDEEGQPRVLDDPEKAQE